MGTGSFVASPEGIQNAGSKIMSIAEEFNTNMNKLYATIEQMVNSDYLSPEAYVLANEIKEYKPKLINIRNIMASYGTFCQGTSTDVVNNQEDLSDQMRGA